VTSQGCGYTHPVALADFDLHLRPAVPEDADFFYLTRRACFRRYVEATLGPWTDDFHRPIADQEFAELAVEIVEQAGAPIGYLAIAHRADHLFLNEIALVPAVQRRGLGSELVQLLMSRARDAGLPLRLSVLSANPAQQLYLRLGFVVTRVEPPRVKMAWTPEP
jgi:ribosomal protein S18 acetylase RimI-like enzyme